MDYVPQQQDVVSGEQYRYALINFVSPFVIDAAELSHRRLSQRIAHEEVEQQRLQLEEQEKQVALLRDRIGLLEGRNDQSQHGKHGGSSVDDFSIKVFMLLLLGDDFSN